MRCDSCGCEDESPRRLCAVLLADVKGSLELELGQ
jgi:hypothetical protein